MLTKTGRIMFVDDEEGVRRSWDRLLSERGFQVTTVEDGERAISRLREEAAEVVVSDLKMPGLDGLALLEWLREMQPQTRFILLTGYGNEVVERRARELGAYGYLNKPISPEALAMVITAALQKEKRKEEVARAAAVEAPALEVPAVAPAEEVVPEKQLSAWRAAGRLVLAPIAGLAFVMFLPVIGFGMFFWAAAQAVRKRRSAAAA